MNPKERKEESKRADSIFRSFINLFQSKGSEVPEWLKARKKSEIASKANAASKILRFIEDVRLTQDKIREIYKIERNYEIDKIVAMEEYPHVPKVMKTIISEAREKKMKSMQMALTKSQFNIYEKLFRKSKQFY